MNPSERRFFYHSFPRPRPNDAPEVITSKGIEILRSIKEIGLLLAPEIVRWETPVSIGSPSPILLPQTRISFTELSENELGSHSKMFGPFALEFELEDLRREGAMPVIYVPQARSAEDLLTLTGAIMVSHLGHTQYLVKQLHQLAQLSDPEQAMKLLGTEHVTSVREDYTLNLSNSGDNGEIVQSTEVPAKTIREILNYLGFRNAPFNSMIGVLTLTQSLFYPTDNEHAKDDLAYYREREWRITGGYDINAKSRGRALTYAEKQQVLSIDAAFWSRKDQVDNVAVSRIERAMVLNQFRERSPTDYIRRILVPKAAELQAREMFGEKVSVQPQL
ncbi:abortive infection system antitoxin AbiGi family protein [Hoeflea sp. AS16]|uniref:abortive infection system antitoxin AbiGi family protein n=1 Tax=Hoeflea sp. AS16 TaxID=3135779 RepID=UPI003179633F